MRLLSNALFVCLVGLSADGATRFEPPDVHELEERPERFIGPELRAVGRFASAGAGRIRLVGSRIDFRLGPEARVYSNPQHVSLVGKLLRENGKLVFQITSLVKIPPDSERFAQYRSRITAADYSILYDLAAWAQQRASWYMDRQLARLASETYRQAFRWETESLGQQGDVEKLLALANRASQYDIPNNDVIAVRFRALSIALDKLTMDDAAGRFQLAARIRDLLPGAELPDNANSQRRDADLNEMSMDRYLETPAADRGAVHRALYRKVINQALLIESRGDSPNFADLAVRAKKLIPEQPELGRSFEVRDLQQRAAKIESLQRSQMLELRDGFERLGEANQARHLAIRWLTARRTNVADSDSEARLNLARDYLDLLGDTETASQLYQQAIAIAPSQEAEAALQRLGWVRMGNAWKRRDEIPSGQASVNVASVKTGDSEQTVLEILRRPDQVARTAGIDWILEQWRYKGPPALCIYMRRNPATGAAVVSRVVAP